jgi:hypothetical protein
MQVLSIRKPLLLLLFLTGVYGGKGYCQELNAATIPDSLRREAVAVRRMDETELDIESPRKAKLHYRRLVTVLNSSGDFYANIITYYDKFHKLNTATAVMYDANGKELKKIKKNEMDDMVLEGSGTVMSDTRIKLYHFVNHSYPYTVSYEEETELDGFFMLPQWLPQPTPSLAVEDCRLVVKAPAAYEKNIYLGDPQQAGYPPRTLDPFLATPRDLCKTGAGQFRDPGLYREDVYLDRHGQLHKYLMARTGSITGRGEEEGPCTGRRTKGRS